MGKSDRRSVLILNWRDSSHPDGGGSEVYVEHVAAGLAAEGWEVTLFCARPRGLPRSEPRDGYTIVRRGGRFTVYLWAALLTLARRLGDPDLLVEVQNGMPFLAATYTRRPVVVLVHHVHREQWQMVMPEPLASTGWWMESRVAVRANRHRTYVAVSEVTKQELVHLGVNSERISVVHNGADPAPSPRGQRSGEPTVLVLGRLVPHKRVEIVLDAAAQLRSALPDLRVVVAGSGWWEQRLRTHCAALDLTDVVEFTGHVSEADKHRLLDQAWVLALPSLKEGWGLVVSEAAAHGVPTLAFRGCGGLDESVVDGVTGVLVDDVSTFAATLRALLVEPGERERMGDHARDYAARFTWEDTVSGFTSALMSAPGAPRSSRSVNRQRVP